MPLEARMKRTLDPLLLAGILMLGTLALSAAGASAQTRPEANRGVEASPSQRGQPSERSSGAQRGEEQAPSDERPSAQDQGPPLPGCQDQGRKLELIV
jgi:hypothetical protein